MVRRYTVKRQPHCDSGMPADSSALIRPFPDSVHCRHATSFTNPRKMVSVALMRLENYEEVAARLFECPLRRYSDILQASYRLTPWILTCWNEPMSKKLPIPTLPSRRLRSTAFSEGDVCPLTNTST